MAFLFSAALPLPAQAAAAPVQDFVGVLAAYDRWLTESDPISAGQRGDVEAASRWPDDSATATRVRMVVLAKVQQRLSRIATTSLTGEDALNHAILSWRIDTDLRGQAFDEARIPFTSDEGFYRTPDYVAGTTILHDRAEARAWLDRLRRLPAYYETETGNMRRGIADGFVQPRQTADAASRITAEAAAVRPEDDPLLAPLATLPAAMPQQERTALRAEALALITTKVKPAEAALASFFATTYRPAARPTIGAASLPQGRAYYAFLVRRETTTDLSPDAIMAIGESEIARIRTAMSAQMVAAGFHGELHAFQTMLRTDRRFSVDTPEALLEKASRLAKRVDDQLPHLFGRLPRLSYGVRPVPANIAEGYTSARYNPGSPQQGVAGGLMINTAHLDQRKLYELPALVAHEGAPGHHIQIALAQELDALPPFRRDLQVTAFVEGWALYAEQLGVEIGLYTTPYERFGLLSMEMWRACRLVMDVGIHWRGWSRDHALACLRDNTALAETNMQSEVDRYIAWPGQALGYKVGELRILALRHQAEAALGPRFDLRRFHDVLLDEGAMPLPVLETRVADWLGRAK